MYKSRTNVESEPFKKKARIILRPDGSIHIAFDTSTSILATRRAILELFSNPIAFIEGGCTKYKETTSEICRARNKAVQLEDIPYLDLAYITECRQVVCEFTELFSKLYTEANDENLDEPLNMKPMFTGTAGQQLSDEKALLLRYYLEVSSILAEKEPPKVERHIKLRDEVQLAVMKVAMTAFTSPKGKLKAEQIALDERLDAAKQPAEETIKEEKKPGVITTEECAEITGYSEQTIRNKIKSGEIKGYKDAQGNYLVENKNLPMKRAKQNKKVKEESLAGNYDETQRIIRENNFFTPAIAPFIMNQHEMNFFAEKHKETTIDGRPALLLDIHPEFVTQDGRTNRQRILAGASPISPDSPTGEPYELHHIARRMDGPLAIVTTEDHDKHSKYFHQAPKDPNMDRPTFDMQRISFFNSYLVLYDKGGYDAIPYLNSPRQLDTTSETEIKAKKKTKARKNKQEHS